MGPCQKSLAVVVGCGMLALSAGPVAAAETLGAVPVIGAGVPAAPTRHFDVEKADILPVGQSRVGGNVQIGGLGLAGISPRFASGLNMRADMNIRPGMEGGIGLTGMGAGGTRNLLANLNLRGKMAMTSAMVGTVPLGVSAMATAGGFLTGGGLSSGSIGFGIPISALVARNIDVTLVPGVAFGYAASGVLPGTTTTGAGTLGFIPAMGLGMDIGITDNISAIIDGNLGFSGGLGMTGNAGLRFGLGNALAADVFLGYKGNPLSAFNSGTLGVGGTFAF